MKGVYTGCLSVFLVFFLSVTSVFGQINSVQDGDWDDINTWDCGCVPDFNDATILIGHNVTVVTDVTIDETFITTGGSLTINAGVVVTLNEDFVASPLTVEAGRTLTVNGTLDGSGLIISAIIVNGSVLNLGTISTLDPSVMSFGANANYTHSHASGGDIPLATWDATSNVLVNGMNQVTTPLPPNNLNQSFGNFTWNCPAQGTNASFNFGGQLNSIQGTLTFQSSNARPIRFHNGGNGYTLTIGQDFINQASPLILTASATTATTITVGRDYIQSGGSLTFKVSTSSSVRFEVGRNFSKTTGAFAGGTGTGAATLAFNGGISQTQSYTMSGTSPAAINYEITTNSTVNAGTSIFTGTGAFTLQGGATLGLGSIHASGALQNTTTLDADCGNIIVSGTRTFTTGSTIAYNATTGTQFIGNGFPPSGDVNLTINNSNNVTLSTSLAILSLRTLTLTLGNLSIGAQTLTLNGTITGSGGLIGGPTSNLAIGGTGNFGILTFNGTNQLLDFTLNRTSSGLVTLGGNLEILGTFTHTAGTLAVASTTLTLSGNYEPANPDILSVTNSSTIVVGGSGTLPSDLGFTGPGLGTLTLNRSGAILATTSSIPITNLNLTSGTFSNGTGIAIATGGTITRAGGIMTNNPTNTTNAYNVVYGVGTFTSGPELPSSTTALANLSKTGSGTVTLASAITINGTLTLSSGNFNAGSNAIDFKGNFVSNAGSTFTSSSVTFSGTSIISGSSAPVFGSVSISGTLTPSINVQYNGALTITSTGSLNAGSITTIFGGTTPITIASGGTASFNNMTVNASSSVTMPAVVLSVANITNSGTFNGAAANLNVSGSVTNNGTFAGSSGTLAVSGGITNTSGTFTSYTNVSAASLTNSGGTFIAPSGDLTLTGDFTNNATFTNNSGTVIFNGTSSVLGSTTPVFRNITISGTLTSPATLQLNGNLTNNGVFNRGTGTVLFSGNTTQSIDGSVVTDFNNISVTNTAGPPAVQVQTNANLRGILTLASNSQFDPNGSGNNRVFTLISTDDEPVSDAAIAAIPSGAGMYQNAPVTVQRYMSIEGGQNGRIYRFISSPVNSPTVAQIQNELPITGTFTTPSSCLRCTPTFQSMLQYDENVITDINGDSFVNLNDGYTDFPVSSNTETLTNGRGYTLLVRADIAPISTAGSARWDVTNPINSGTISFNSFVTFTSSGTLANDGWNFVGNPYPSTIDWDAPSGWTRTGINDAIYMKDNGTNLMAAYVGGVATNGGSRYIAMGQGFTVKSDGGPIDFQVNENAKAPGVTTSFIREGSINDLLRIALKRGSLKDETVIRFAEGATEGFDIALDAYKYMNQTFVDGDYENGHEMAKLSILNLSSVSKGSRWAINALPGTSSCTSTVSLDVSDVIPGNYELEFSDFESFDESVQIRLIDTFKGTTVNIRNTTSYNFDVTTDLASYGDRFKISFQKGSSVATDLMLIGNDVCAGAEASIQVTNSQAGINYFASVGGSTVSEIVSGNGGNVTLSVSSQNLAIGKNNILIMASSPGCDPIPMEKNVVVNTQSLLEVNSVQHGLQCSEGAVKLFAFGAPSEGKYNWYETRDALAPIENAHQAEFITPILNKTKTYYVAVVNALGCEGARTEVRAEILHHDEAAISVVDDKLVSSYAGGNQWYKDGDKIEGATEREFVPTESGQYMVEVTNGTCITSATVYYLVNGEGGNAITGLNIYPNPVKSNITIEMQSKNKVAISLYDGLGSKLVNDIELSESRGDGKTGQLDLTSRSPGFYFILIKDGKQLIWKKILKK